MVSIWGSFSKEGEVLPLWSLPAPTWLTKTVEELDLIFRLDLVLHFWNNKYIKMIRLNCYRTSLTDLKTADGQTKLCSFQNLQSSHKCQYVTPHCIILTFVAVTDFNSVTDSFHLIFITLILWISMRILVVVFLKSIKIWLAWRLDLSSKQNKINGTLRLLAIFKLSVEQIWEM